MADDRLYSEKEIKNLIPVPVICEIPVIGAPADGSSGNERAWRGWAAAAVVVAVIAAGSVLSYLRG
jgi:hypothetical protein